MEVVVEGVRGNIIDLNGFRTNGGGGGPTTDT